MTTSTPLSELLRVERQVFLDDLESLTPAQWQQRSLCSEWRVIDVAAHLAWAPVLGPVDGALAFVRSRLSVNRMIAATAIDWSSRGREAILEQLGRNLDSGAKPIGMPTVAALADAVVHAADVRRPLGLSRAVPAEALHAVADFVLATPWPLNGVVGGNAGRRIGGLRLVADDADWRVGNGPDVVASAETLALLLYGRRVDASELSGEGASVVLERM